MPSTLPIQAPTNMEGMNKPAGTYDRYNINVLPLYITTFIPNVNTVRTALAIMARMRCQKAVPTAGNALVS